MEMRVIPKEEFVNRLFNDLNAKKRQSNKEAIAKGRQEHYTMRDYNIAKYERLKRT